MSGRYLLDTNISIALFADEIAVKNSLAQKVESCASFTKAAETFTQPQFGTVK
jgi:hypothetical protein